MKEENRGTFWSFRDGIKRAKACLEVTGKGHVEGNRMDFCKYVKTKRQTAENVELLLRDNRSKGKDYGKG